MLFEHHSTLLFCAAVYVRLIYLEVINVIVLEEEAFYGLYYKLVAYIEQQFGVKRRDKWIGGDEAMEMLRIKSRTTLQKLRDQGKIRYSQPMPKLILYDSASIDAYLEKYAKDSF